MEIDSLYLIHGLHQIFLREEHLVWSNVAAHTHTHTQSLTHTCIHTYIHTNVSSPNFDVIWEEPSIDSFGGMSHEHPSLERGLSTHTHTHTHTHARHTHTDTSNEDKNFSSHKTFSRNQGSAPQWSKWKLLVNVFVCVYLRLEGGTGRKGKREGEGEGGRERGRERKGEREIEVRSLLWYKQEVNLLCLNHVCVGQRIHPRQARVYATVQLHTHTHTHNTMYMQKHRLLDIECTCTVCVCWQVHHYLDVLELQDDTGTPHLLSRPPTQYTESALNRNKH